MRIVSLVSAATEMLFALQLDNRVVAISHECDWPPQCNRLPRVTRSNVNPAADSEAIDQQVRDLIVAGRPLYEIDVEQLIAVQPDLIVTQSQCDVCAVRYEDVVAAVRSRPELTQARILALNPTSLNDVFDDLIRIGQAADVRVHSEQVVAELRNRVEWVRGRTAQIPFAEWPRTAIIEWTSPLMLAGNWVPGLLEIAGGKCALALAGVHSRTHQWQEILEFNPHVIVVCPCGFNAARAKTEIRQLASRPGWQSIDAVKAGRVHALDGNAYFNRPGPRLVDSLEQLSSLLHPLA